MSEPNNKPNNEPDKKHYTIQINYKSGISMRLRVYSWKVKQIDTKLTYLKIEPVSSRFIFAGIDNIESIYEVEY